MDAIRNIYLVHYIIGMVKLTNIHGNYSGNAQDRLWIYHQWHRDRGELMHNLYSLFLLPKHIIAATRAFSRPYEVHT